MPGLNYINTEHVFRVLTVFLEADLWDSVSKSRKSKCYVCKEYNRLYYMGRINLNMLSDSPHFKIQSVFAETGSITNIDHFMVIHHIQLALFQK